MHRARSQKLSEPEENTAEQHEVGSHTQELHSARKAAVPSPLTVFGKFGKAAPRAASKVRVYASSDSATPGPLASSVFREKLAGFTVEPHKPQDEQGSPQVPEESEVLETSKAARGQQSDTIPTPAIFARPRIVAEQASRKMMTWNGHLCLNSRMNPQVLPRLQRVWHGLHI